MLNLVMIAIILVPSIGFLPEAHAAQVRIMALPYAKVTFVASKAVNNTARPYESIGVTDTFTIVDDAVFLFIKFDNLSYASWPHKLTLKAFDPQGHSFGEQNFEIKDPGEGLMWLWIARYWNLGEPSLMAVGEWRAEADLDDLFITGLKFTIQAPTPASFVACRVDTSKSYKCDPSDRTDSFNMTTDNTVYVLFVMGTVRGMVPVSFTLLDPQGRANYTWTADHGAGYSTSFHWPLSTLTPGNWTMQAFSGGKTIASFTFVIYPKVPHLVLARPVEVSKPETVYPGDTITLKYTLKNDGGSTAKNVQLQLSNVTQGLTVMEQTEAKDLPAGSSDEWAVKITADQPGNYSFTVEPVIANQTVMEAVQYNTLISEQPFLGGLSLYLGIAAVIAVVLVAVFALRRRRKLGIQSAPLGVAQQPPTRFCRSCGAQLAPGQQFCGKCGSGQS